MPLYSNVYPFAIQYSVSKAGGTIHVPRLFNLNADALTVGYS